MNDEEWRVIAAAYEHPLSLYAPEREEESVSQPVVYVSIGNSDDRLSQVVWHNFYVAVNLAIRALAESPGGKVHGAWLSEPASAYQNACWAVRLPDDPAAVENLRTRLAELASEFHQDSIAWAVAPTTEFIGMLR